MSNHLLSSLNESQRRSVELTEGPLLIIAGAGSGKTRMITHRIAYLMEKNVAPQKILALTFTNKAAREMGERIADLRKGKKGEAPLTATFHSFAMMVLKNTIHLLGYTNRFTIYDTQDSVSLMKEVMREHDVDITAIDARDLLDVYSRFRRGQKDAAGEYIGLTRQLCESFQEHKKAYNALDFDDLIYLLLEIFSTHEEVLEQYRRQFQYIMVDEFQDTSREQYRIVRLLAQEHRNLAVVGDDDQSIYSWRGADYGNIIQFEKDFPERTEIFLDRNYRSTGMILSAANQLILNNSERKKKNLWTQEDQGTAITLIESEDSEKEAADIAERIRQDSFTHNRPYSDYAILVRTNHLLPTLETQLMDRHMSVNVSGGMSFYDRREVKDVIAYIRVLVNKNDDIALLRIINTPKRRIGLTTLKYLRSIKDSHGISYYEAIRIIVESPSSENSRQKDALSSFLNLIDLYSQMFMGERNGKHRILSRLLDEIHYRSYLIGEYPTNEKTAQAKYLSALQYIKFFRQWEEEHAGDESIYDYLRRLTLTSSEKSDRDEGTSAISLMTMHASKGLEFHTVFLAGIEDSIIPHRRSVEENDGNLEEERRLFYVAITRARKHLFISYAKMRKVRGEQITTSPSRFLSEITDVHFAAPEEPKEMTKEDHMDRLKAFLNVLDDKERKEA